MAENAAKNDGLGETFVPGKTAGAAARQDTDGPDADTKAQAKKSGSAGEKKKDVQLGDFKLLKKLGQGGMGEVYLATDIKLDRNVALKILSKDMAKKPGFVERFVREARAMAKIDHPNAVKVYAADSDKGYNYAAIEYIDGKSMQHWMNQLGKLPVGDAVHVTLCCADALAHAHELTLIHRDIKPDNILVTKKGAVKVADFGLAKALDDEDMSMTQSGTGLGTPLYMPPEQARNAKSVDHRTDIYALGITLYYFLTGKLPFEGETVLKLIVAKEKGSYPPLRKHNPQVPEKLELIVDKMIQKEPKHRYATCADVIADLERLNLESQVLSFIDPAETAGRAAGRTRQRSSVGATAVPTSQATSMPTLKTSAEDAAEAQAKATAKDSSLWFVKYTNAKGETTVKEMSTRQVQQGILSEALDVKTQAQRKDQQTGFLPLAAYPEFQDLVKKRLVVKTTEVKAESMKEMYAKIDKEHKRAKIWRSIRAMTESTLGFVGLIIYLILIAAALVGLYFLVVKLVYPWLSQWVPQ